jgi:hypothetical protein
LVQITDKIWVGRVEAGMLVGKPLMADELNAMQDMRRLDVASIVDGCM